jgi:hypothetical protein
LVREKETIMMNGVAPGRISTSVSMRVAGLFVLLVLAVAFFAFPLVSFAASENVNNSFQLVGIIQANQVLSPDQGQNIFNSISAPIVAGKASQLKGGLLVLVRSNTQRVFVALSVGPGKGVIKGTTQVVDIE